MPMIRFVKRSKAQHFLELHDMAGPAAPEVRCGTPIRIAERESSPPNSVAAVEINYTTLEEHPPR